MPADHMSHKAVKEKARSERSTSPTYIYTYSDSDTHTHAHTHTHTQSQIYTFKMCLAFKLRNTVFFHCHPWAVVQHRTHAAIIWVRASSEHPAPCAHSKPDSNQMESKPLD